MHDQEHAEDAWTMSMIHDAVWFCTLCHYIIKVQFVVKNMSFCFKLKMNIAEEMTDAQELGVVNF